MRGSVLRGSPVLLALFGVLALLAVWILGSPPNSAPDEPANIVRGYGAGTGQWSGTGRPGVHTAGFGEQVRLYRVPPRLDILNKSACFTNRQQPADCQPFFTRGSSTQAVSGTGAYYPVVYVPLGLAERLTGSPAAEDYAGRTVSAVLGAALLTLAYACLRRRVHRVAWLIALTPVTLFATASAATNGLEICGGITLLCGMQALRDGPRRVGITAFVLGGLVLVSAKELGPAWWIALVVLGAAVGRFRHWGPPPWAWTPPLLGLVANVIWTLRFLPGASATTTTLREQVALARREVRSLPQETYSGFGLVNVPVMHFLWDVGVAGFATFVVVCLLRTDWWGRLVIVLAAVTAYAAAVAFTVVEIRGGFGYQARYTLVVTASVPLLAAFAVSARRRPEPRWLALVLGWPIQLLTASAAIAASLFGVYYNLKRYATGDAARGFLHHAAWVPPGGISLEVVLAVAGAAALALAVVAAPERGEDAGTPVT